MPTRKMSDREKLTLFARAASDDELEEAIEILTIERRVRTPVNKPKRTRTRTATKKPAVELVDPPAASDQ